MNGKLMSAVGMGFKKIVIHTKANHHIEVDKNKIRLTDGQSTVSFLWTQTPTNHSTDRYGTVQIFGAQLKTFDSAPVIRAQFVPVSCSVSLTLRNNEVEVSAQSVHVLILLHHMDGDRFLWPAVKQRPLNTALVGIMGN